MESNNQLSIVSGTSALTISQQKEVRTSALEAPNMLLSGHTAPIYSISFSPDGNSIASAGFDGNIMLWDVFGECKNYNVLTGHKNAITQISWPSKQCILSASADKTVACWDANKGQRIRKYSEHSNIVNCVAAPTPTGNTEQCTVFASGGDDCNVILWDVRCRESIAVIELEYQVLSVAFSGSGDGLYSGGIDNIIRRWDLRNLEEPVQDMELTGHSDSITGLAVSPDSHHLLSTGMDSSLVSWDTRPFVAPTLAGGSGGSSSAARVEKTFPDVNHNPNEKNLLRCSWSPDQERVACGSADRIVKIWDFTSTQLLYYLPGHKGSVNDVKFHPTQPIVASCGTDKQIFLGELS